MPSTDCNKWLTASQVAKHLGCSRSHIYRLMRAGRLAHYDLGEGVKRINAADLDTFLESCRESA